MFALLFSLSIVASAYDFSGIVRLGGCSGSLVRFTSSQPNDPALALTNGHCIEGGRPAPGAIRWHQVSARPIEILAANGDSLGRVRSTEIIYATMTGSDLALYKLASTFAEIDLQFGVQPLTLATTGPTLNQSLEILSGRWKTAYQCQAAAFAFHLVEGPYEMNDAIRFSTPGCETIAGTSGSPVLATGTRDVIAINSTGNEDGERCTVNNPCEVDEQGGVLFQKGYNYAQQTYELYSCLNSARELDLNLSGCTLARGLLPVAGQEQ